jgi:micrococcal nuclease
MRQRVFMPMALLMLGPLCTANAGPQSFEVEKVEDGDTLVVYLQGSLVRLQLSGIDAPEDTDNAKLKRDIKVSGLSPEALLALGAEATRYLAALVKPGDQVRVEEALGQPDRYGRIPVMVYDSSGRAINDAMVADGYAVVLRFGEMDAELKARLEGMEAEAIAARRGLWGEKRADALAWGGHADK